MHRTQRSTPLPGVAILQSLYVLYAWAFVVAACLFRPVTVDVDPKQHFHTFRPDSHGGRQFTSFRISGIPLVCGDVSTAATRPWNASNGLVLDQWTPEAQTLRYLALSKTGWLTDHCYLFRRTSDPLWVFDICIGRSVGKYIQDRDFSLAQGRYFSLGIYDPTQDTVYANGTLVQHYIDGTDNRSTSIHFDCDTESIGTVFSVTEVSPIRFKVLFKASTFCDWRPFSAPRSSIGFSSAPPRESRLTLSDLVQNLQSWCSNFTTGGWWTYEYCYPDSLIQFHRSRLNAQNQPMIAQRDILVLGSLKFPGNFRYPAAGPTPPGEGSFATERSFETPPLHSAFPTLQSPHRNTADPGAAIHWPSLPFYMAPATEISISDKLLGQSDNILGRPLQTLVLDMHNGTYCGRIRGQSRFRQARVFIYCPRDFYRRSTTRITQIREAALCQYEVFIASPMVCAHPELLPVRPAMPETVLCYTMPTKDGQNNRTIQGTIENGTFPSSSTVSNNDTQIFTRRLPEAIRRLILQHHTEHIPKAMLYAALAPTSYPNHTLDTTYRISGLQAFVKFFSNVTFPGQESRHWVPHKTGEFVRHERLNLPALVLGWDLQISDKSDSSPGSTNATSGMLNTLLPKRNLFYFLLVVDDATLTTGAQSSNTVNTVDHDSPNGTLFSEDFKNLRNAETSGYASDSVYFFYSPETDAITMFAAASPYTLYHDPYPYCSGTSAVYCLQFVLKPISSAETARLQYDTGTALVNTLLEAFSHRSGSNATKHNVLHHILHQYPDASTSLATLFNISVPVQAGRTSVTRRPDSGDLFHQKPTTVAPSERVPPVMPTPLHTDTEEYFEKTDAFVFSDSEMDHISKLDSHNYRNNEPSFQQDEL